MKTTCHCIRKIPSAERQENDFFLWQYESLEFFSLYTGWNPSVEVSIRRIFFSKTSRGGGLCAVFLGGIDQFENLCEGEGLKFVFKFRLMIHEIGGHALTEGFRLSVPDPSRVQIFFLIWWTYCQNLFWSHLRYINLYINMLFWSKSIC